MFAASRSCELRVSPPDNPSRLVESMARTSTSPGGDGTLARCSRRYLLLASMAVPQARPQPGQACGAPPSKCRSSPSVPRDLRPAAPPHEARFPERSAAGMISRNRRPVPSGSSRSPQLSSSPGKSSPSIADTGSYFVSRLPVNLSCLHFSSSRPSRPNITYCPIASAA